MGLFSLINRLRQDRKGSMAIETAFVVPVLATISIGVFETGAMVSRQQELQSAASEAEAIILAAVGGAGAESSQIEDVIETSLNLTDDQFTISQRFRCNTAANLVTAGDLCDASDPIYRYVQIVLTDSYTPVWTNFGVGQGVNYSLTRTIQIS